MLPSENLSIGRSVIGSRTIVASKFCTLSLCENGAGEVPRYQEMVGTGLPVELQVMLIESPSCIVTVPFRFMTVGAPADMVKLYGSLICMFNYHHRMKLYQKISRVCCRLYCYECATQVIMPTAINQWYSFVLW